MEKYIIISDKNGSYVCESEKCDRDGWHVVYQKGEVERIRCPEKAEDIFHNMEKPTYGKLLCQFHFDQLHNIERWRS